MSAYSDYIVSLGPALYWRLGEANGAGATVPDTSGNARNGSMGQAGANRWGNTGLLAAEPSATSAFNGTLGSWATISADGDSALETTGSFSAVLWFKQTGNNPFNDLITLYGPGGGTGPGALCWELLLAWGLHGGPGSVWDLQFSRYGNAVSDSQITTNNAYPTNDGTIYMVGIVHDATNHLNTIYVQGVAAVSGADNTAGYDPTMGPGMTLDVGDLSNLFYQDAAYWTRVLSPTEMASIYTAGTVGLPSYVSYSGTIGGDVANIVAGSLNVVQQVGQRSTANFDCWTPLAKHWGYGTQVIVNDASGDRVFAGFVQTDDASRSDGVMEGVGPLYHTITLMDMCYLADKRLLFASYLGQTCAAIISDMLTKVLAAEGVTVIGTPGTGGSSVQLGATILEWISNGKPCTDTLNYLAQQSGYWWNIDQNRVLWFQPAGGVPAPWALDGSQADSMQGVHVKYGNDRYLNSQYVKGAYNTVGPLTETFHGNSLNRAFTLSYEVSAVSAITVNSVAKTFGTKGLDSGKDFYCAVGDAVIAQDMGGTLLAAGDTLAVTYKGRYPVQAVARNRTAIARQRVIEGGGTGIVEAMYSDTHVHSLGAAFSIANALLSHYGQDVVTLDFSTLTPGLAAGQFLLVSLPDFDLASYGMLITQVNITDSTDGLNIWYTVEAVGGPYDVGQWQVFWQGLMNQQTDPNDPTNVGDSEELAEVFTVFNSLTYDIHPAGVVKNLCSFPSSTTYPGFDPC